MPGKTDKAILIVDDDASFRQLIAETLAPTGFRIIQVRNSTDALSALNEPICMAIVDYRLPDLDGIRLITLMRERNFEAPIVFVSGTWCDPKTFNWLRGILRVSLILQKPVDPNLFYQQVEALLPAHEILVEEEAAVDTTRATTQLEYEKLMRAAADMAGAELKSSTELRAVAQELTGSDEQNLKSQMREINQKIGLEEKIKAVQMRLRQGIGPEWEILKRAVSALQAAPTNAEHAQEAEMQAHKLRGTAGSLGMMRVSAAAGKIEDFLILMKNGEDTEKEILWSEIFRSLADGETGLRLAIAKDIKKEEAELVMAGKVLLFALDETFKSNIEALNPYINVNFTLAQSPMEAVMKAAATRFDAAIIDASLCGSSGAMRLTREIRSSLNNKQLPLAILPAPGEPLQMVDVLYGGYSAVLKDRSQSEFEGALKALSKARNLKRTKILTVDDDSVLTRFIETILDSFGMEVSVLNEPIEIMERMEEVMPDVVLLDVIMPGLSGYDLCRLLRDDERWRNIPIIFLTSKSDAQGRAAAFRAGANDFLSKPVLTEELLARIEAQLARSREQREGQQLDEITGVLNEETWQQRTRDLINGASARKENYGICLMTINYFDELDRYGIFASLNALSLFGRLLQSRFKAECLRGRFENSGFALSFANEDKAAVFDAMQLLAAEIKQMPLSGEHGQRVELDFSFGISTHPENARSFEELFHDAKVKLQGNIREKTGVTFFK